MDSAYRNSNYLNVKRTGYNGYSASYNQGKHSRGSVPGENAEKRVQTYREEGNSYRMTGKKSVAVKKEEKAVAPFENGKAKGFVYVEHSGFKGTFRDAFKTKRVKSKEKSCFDKVVLILMFAVLLFFVAGSYCEYYGTFRSINQMKSEIAECREEQAKLLVAIEERNDRLGIEDYAVNNLGMVKSDKLTTHYVSISDKDVVNISVSDENEAMTGGILLSGFKNVVSNFTDKN